VGTGVGTFKRVRINNIICDAPLNDMPAIIAGIPEHPIEDISVHDVFIRQKGSSTAKAEIDPPEEEGEYPEPSFFGPLPALALMIRHAKNIEIRHLEATSIAPDQRPFVWLSDVDRIEFSGLNVSPRDDVPVLQMHETHNLQVSKSRGLSDILLKYVSDGQYPVMKIRPPRGIVDLRAAIARSGLTPNVFSNSGSRCQALHDHPCRAHCSLRGRGVPSA
jgi:hypothetical protein